MQSSHVVYDYVQEQLSFLGIELLYRLITFIIPKCLTVVLYMYASEAHFNL
jgi:hypothetical protein